MGCYWEDLHRCHRCGHIQQYEWTCQDTQCGAKMLKNGYDEVSGRIDDGGTAILAPWQVEQDNKKAVDKIKSELHAANEYLKQLHINNNRDNRKQYGFNPLDIKLEVNKDDRR